MRNSRWLFICSYDNHKDNVSNLLLNLNKILNHNLARYHRYLLKGDFIVKTDGKNMKEICNNNHKKKFQKHEKHPWRSVTFSKVAGQLSANVGHHSLKKTKINDSKPHIWILLISDFQAEKLKVNKN